jgi:glycosyltransferase involved in cell wall biosynthesis
VINFSISIITATRDRSHTLQNKAIPSLLQQTDQDFEWVVVNDGADLQTRQVIDLLQTNFPIVYREIEHTKKGFGLAHGRNCGLEAATGDIVCYLDDDNSLAPGYIAAVKAFFCSNPQTSFSMVQQSRHRDVYQQGQLIRQGKTFISPTADCTVEDLILHRQLFDSNGFAHLRSGSISNGKSVAPKWNPDYRIFIDYEYFLRCLGCWGSEGFALVPEVLVDYVQSSEGIIGRSKYEEWAEEIDRLCTSGQYAALNHESILELLSLARSWRRREGRGVSAFAPGDINGKGNQAKYRSRR